MAQSSVIPLLNANVKLPQIKTKLRARLASFRNENISLFLQFAETVKERKPCHRQGIIILQMRTVWEKCNLLMIRAMHIINDGPNIFIYCFK